MIATPVPLTKPRTMAGRGRGLTMPAWMNDPTTMAAANAHAAPTVRIRNYTTLKLTNLRENWDLIHYDIAA